MYPIKSIMKKILSILILQLFLMGLVSSQSSSDILELKKRYESMLQDQNKEKKLSLDGMEDDKIETEKLCIKECYANGGSHIKRFRAASMGRISRLNKPTSHLTIIVSDNN